MKLTTRIVVVTAALGALRFVLSLAGATIPGVIGIPGMSGVINILWAGAFLALPPLITRSFWSSTLSATFYSLLALPLPLSGPSGFFPKILIGITTGLLADVIYTLLKRQELGAALGIGAAGQTLLGFEIAWLGMLFRVPGIDKYAAIQFSLAGILSTILGGTISGLLGWAVYRRMRDSDVVKRVRSPI